jgi:hypothetical protein
MAVVDRPHRAIARPGPTSHQPPAAPCTPTPLLPLCPCPLRRPQSADLALALAPGGSSECASSALRSSPQGVWAFLLSAVRLLPGLWARALGSLWGAARSPPAPPALALALGCCPMSKSKPSCFRQDLGPKH